jgi:hypothetical protein
LIPLKSYPSGAGYEAMLFNGILGAAGLAMIIPMFVPSRWRTRDDEAGAEATAAEDYVSSLAGTTESQEPAGSADTVQPVRLSLTAGTMPGTPPLRPKPPGERPVGQLCWPDDGPVQVAGGHQGFC